MSGESSRSRRLHLVACTALVLAALLQRPGLITFDTKLDLSAAPGAGLAHLGRLWSASTDFGSLGNQDYGYLFPQGTWFALLDLAHVPAWVSQRLWTALVLLVAYEGARRLARALRVGTGTVPVLVGLAFALSPRLFALAGVLSAEVLPSAVLPWLCLPLVLAHQGRLSPRRAGLLSGLAVLAMGGVNAVENLATFPLPLLVVLSGLPSAAGRRLAGWWALATTAASLWWVLPLLVMGRYSPPFLDYIETAAATTRPTGWSNSLRGAEHWVGYIFVGGRPYWAGAYELSTAGWLMFLAGVVSALGLLGLFAPRPRAAAAGGGGLAPYRLSLLLGLGLLVVGTGGLAGSPIAPWVRDLLDGLLAPFRNVHKVDPLVRLPLALGLGRAALLGADWLRETWTERRGGDRRVVARQAALGTAFVLVLLTGYPAAANQLREPGWRQVPAGWVQAGTWLESRSGTTLVVPATAFGMQRWGWTVDEPLQALTTARWASRSQIPLVPPPTIRWMDAVESRLQTGTGSSALADTLAAAGVERVLVRRDVDLGAADVADPNRVDLALFNSPGFAHERSFGRSGFGDQPLIDVYRVERPATAVAASDTATMPVLYGGPDDVITAREAGLVAPGQHVRVAATRDAPDIQADGYRRQERQFGRFHDAVSEVMTAEEPYRGGRREADYAGVDGVQRVTARFRGIASVTASTSSGYADTVGPVRPELGPASVVDGDPATYWRSALFEPGRGQWVQLNLREDRSIGAVRVIAGVDGGTGVPVTRLRVSAGGRSALVSVDPVTGRAVADLGGVRADAVRVTVAGLGRDDPLGYVALREVSLPGLRIHRALRLPDAGADAGTSFVFAAQEPLRACVPSVLGPQCSPYAARPSDEQAGLRRRFTVHQAGRWRVSGEVMPIAGAAVADLLQPLPGDPTMTAQASDVYGNDPSVSGRFAVDTDDTTPWLTNPGVRDAVLTVRWKGRRTIDRILVASAAVASVRPSTAVITAGDRRREVSLGGDALGYFKRLRTDEVTIALHGVRGDASLPLGIGDLSLVGAGDLARPVRLGTPTGALCGLGPVLRIDGRTYRTRVDGTLGDVVDGRPLRWSTCGRSRVRLPAGGQRVATRSSDRFVPTRLTLTAAGAGVPPAGRAVEVRSESDTTLTADVGAGEDAVLGIGQNANPGWSARAGGRSLTPVVVDGWQQGFAVPAGDATRVAVRYAPEPTYRTVLLAGLAAAVLLLALLVLDLLRPAPTGRTADRTAAPGVRPGRVGLCALAALGAVLLGPVASVGGVLGGLLGRRLPGLPLAAGPLLVLGSAIAAVYSDRRAAGVPSLGADVLGAVGVGVLAGAWLVRAWADRRVAGEGEGA